MIETQNTLNFLRLANHALRTPLTVVSGCMTLLESFTKIDSDQTVELISRAATRSKESSLITADMMIITETLLDERGPTLRESDLKSLVLEAFEGYDVKLDYPDQELHVFVNEIDFVSALRRIVSSSQRWGEVRVDVVSVAGKARIRIFDLGPPIEQSEDELFVQFEPFADRGVGIHSLSHVYTYVLLKANDATLAYLNLEDEALTEIQLEVL